VTNLDIVADQVYPCMAMMSSFSRIMHPDTHCSGMVEEHDEEFKVLPWPPNSPDLNPTVPDLNPTVSVGCAGAKSLINSGFTSEKI